MGNAYRPFATSESLTFDQVDPGDLAGAVPDQQQRHVTRLLDEGRLFRVKPGRKRLER